VLLQGRKLALDPYSILTGLFLNVNLVAKGTLLTKILNEEN
jgi:hypothetical protein